MRVAIIAPFHAFGGSEHQILHLLRGLQGQDVDLLFCHLAVRSPELLGALESMRSCTHGEIQLRSVKNPFTLASDARQLAGILRRNGGLGTTRKASIRRMSGGSIT
jgi:hypothetical protein